MLRNAFGSFIYGANMNIQRKVFKYTSEQEQDRYSENQVSGLNPSHRQEFVQAENHEREEGFFHKTKVIQAQYRRLNFDELMSQVTEFINSIGKENLVNICETVENQYRIGDIRTKVIVVWYWQADSREAREAILQVHAKGETSSPEVDTAQLAIETCGLSGASIEG